MKAILVAVMVMMGVSLSAFDVGSSGIGGDAGGSLEGTEGGGFGGDAGFAGEFGKS